MNARLHLAAHPVEEPARLALIADPWTRPAFAEKFRAACEADAQAHGGMVNPNRVRLALLNEPDYEPHRYAAQWGPACGRRGFLEKTDVLVPIAGEGSKHNGNKLVPLRRWVA